ncbi:MAG: phage tail assembly chaperone [Candidatus Fimivivens sp.]
MKNLEAFLNPKRKPNMRFVLSEDFVGEDGAPLVWEMRALSARELCDVRSFYEGRGQEQTTLALLAKSLVHPDLSDAQLLQGLSQKEGKSILDPCEALKSLLDAAQLGVLLACYFKHQQVNNFHELVDEAKNS